MSDLVERLEQAADSDRWLDAGIWVAINGKGQPIVTAGPPTYDTLRFFCNPHPEVDWIGYDLLNIAPAYTRSVDAAITLVPDGWAWFVEWIGHPFSEGQARVWIPAQRTQSLRIENIMCAAKTPALALCACALKARVEVENATN